MKLFPIFLFGAMLSATSVPSFAYDNEKAQNNLAHEAAVCAAFFLVLSMNDNNGKETNQVFTKSAKTVHALSIAFSSEELTTARANLAAAIMKSEMKYDWVNLTILDKKYSDTCAKLSMNPLSRIRYLLDKKD